MQLFHSFSSQEISIYLFLSTTGSLVHNRGFKNIWLTSMQSTSWETLDWKKQAGIKIAGRNIHNLRYADDTTLMAEREEELEPLDESERGE